MLHVGGARPDDWSPLSRLSEIPRFATASLLLAALSNGRAAVDGLVNPQYLGSWQWALLSAACVVLAFTAVSRPEYFRLREFRLPGVAVTALALLILTPLPGLVGRHEDRLPPYTTATIAAGMMAFALTIVSVRRPLARPRQVPPAADWELAVPGAIVIVALLMFPIWLRSIGSIPITQLVTGQATGIDIALARQRALSELSFAPLRLLVGALRNTYLMFAAGWFVADVVLARHRGVRQSLGRRALAIGALAMAASYALVTTEKALLGEVWIAAIVASMVVLRKQLTSRMVLGLGALAVAFPVVFGFLNTGGSFGAAVESVRRRIFYLPGDVMVQYFMSFPRRREFLEGSSIPKISRFWGGETFDLSAYVYDVAYGFDDRLQGSANGSFIGVGWANFGMAGVVIWCVAAALALAWIERMLRTLPPRTHGALRGVAVIQSVLLTSADVTRTVLNVAPGFLDLFIAVAVVALVQRTRAIPKRARTVGAIRQVAA